METQKDYGSDPLGNGMFRMVPSGDVVNTEERNRRLPRKTDTRTRIFGLTLDELERKQGGKLNRKH